MSIFLGAVNSIDEHKVNETILFAENNADVLKKFEDIYVEYVKKKVKAKKYDRTKVIKLLEYFYQNYVRPAMKNPRNYGYDPKLNPAERKLFAEYFRENIETNYL
jgi:hypothetical protein